MRVSDQGEQRNVAVDEQGLRFFLRAPCKCLFCTTRTGGRAQHAETCLQQAVPGCSSLSQPGSQARWALTPTIFQELRMAMAVLRVRCSSWGEVCIMLFCTSLPTAVQEDVLSVLLPPAYRVTLTPINPEVWPVSVTCGLCTPPPPAVARTGAGKRREPVRPLQGRRTPLRYVRVHVLWFSTSKRTTGDIRQLAWNGMQRSPVTGKVRLNSYCVHIGRKTGPHMASGSSIPQQYLKWNQCGIFIWRAYWTEDASGAVFHSSTLSGISLEYSTGPCAMGGTCAVEYSTLFPSVELVWNTALGHARSGGVNSPDQFQTNSRLIPD